jgi:uncharacterized membrane protein YkoI
MSGSNRYTARMTRLLPAILVSLALPALAQDVKPDHERAADAVATGAVLPLAEVLARLAQTHPGDVIEVELDDEDGIVVYDLDIVTPDGRLLEIEINAATGAVLDVEIDEDDD